MHTELTALLRLVRVVETVIVVVADVDPRDAVAVGAREEVPEARPALHVALPLVGAVRAVLVAVAVPRGRDAAVVGAAERVRRARPGGSFSAVVISSWGFISDISDYHTMIECIKS